MLLAAFTLFSPASGAFVSLAQATLADVDPTRLEQNMARWTFAGSLGVLVGSFAVGAFASGEEEWRLLFLGVAAASAVALGLAARYPIGAGGSAGPDREPLLTTLRDSVRWALDALRRPDIIRWLTLLEISDLVGDILLGYLALYLTDVAGARSAEAAVGVGLLTAGGLVGDLLVIVLLERMRGLTYLRLNSGMTIVLLAAFLLVPDLVARLILATLLGVAIGGRYAILQAQLYDALPGRSGSALALRNASNIPGSLLPAMIGAAAASWGLGAAMWLLLIGPIGMLIATPRRETSTRRNTPSPNPPPPGAASRGD